jgi:hypothetical protein
MGGRRPMSPPGPEAAAQTHPLDFRVADVQGTRLVANGMDVLSLDIVVLCVTLRM